MCVVSFVSDFYKDKWDDYRSWVNEPSSTPPVNVVVKYPSIDEIREEIKRIVSEELKDFKILYERAKQYDIDNNQPDCELEGKKKILKDFADKLGVKIDFL